MSEVHVIIGLGGELLTTWLISQVGSWLCSSSLWLIRQAIVPTSVVAKILSCNSQVMIGLDPKLMALA